MANNDHVSFSVEVKSAHNNGMLARWSLANQYTCTLTPHQLGLPPIFRVHGNEANPASFSGDQTQTIGVAL